MANKTFLDLKGLSHFKEKIMSEVDHKVQEATNSPLGFQNYGALRNRDSSKPTYGLT